MIELAPECNFLNTFTSKILYQKSNSELSMAYFKKKYDLQYCGHDEKLIPPVFRSKMLSDVGSETAKTQSAVMQREPSLMGMLR